MGKDKLFLSRRTRFVVLYLLFIVIFSLPYLADKHWAGERGLTKYNSFIAGTSAWFYNIFASERAVSRGMIIVTGSTAVEVKTGCNGLLMIIIYCSGIAAFPSSFRYKMQGLLVGMVAIFAFNVVRVDTLILIIKFWPDWFEMAHVTAAQFVGILFALMLWIQWLNGVERA
jgi:exosortase/archaeosortase family protein